MSSLSVDAYAIKHVVCPFCAAPAGKGCVTRSGAIYSSVHSTRTKPLYALYREGYNDGMRNCAMSWARFSPDTIPAYIARYMDAVPS